MLQKAYLMDDYDDDIINEASQILPSCNISSQCTCNVQIPMQCPVQEDVIHEKTNRQLPEHECRTEMAEVPDEQNERDECCSNVRRDRSLTTSNSSNDDQKEKPLSEIIDRLSAYFPHKHVSLSTRWYLYRINISNNNDLGFVVPSELIKLPIFKFYENDSELTVEIIYLKPIDLKQYKYQLEIFCRYIFEEVFDNMNTGLESILKFDIEHSTFQLLPCLLKKSSDIDYQRMASIRDRKNKLIQNLSQLNYQEVYTHLNSPNKQLYMNVTAASLPKRASDPWKYKKPLNTIKSYADYYEHIIDGVQIQRHFPMAAMKRIEKPNIDYLKKSLTPPNKQLNTLSTKSDYYPVEVLRYAPLNQIDSELIYKLPSILVRISQLHHIEQLRQIFADNIQSSSPLDVDQIPIVTFDDCLPQILSSTQSTALSLDSLNYNLLSANNCGLQPSPDLLFQSITGCSTVENTSMKNLAILGDCFLKLVISTSLYHRYPFDDIEELTKKRIKEISNDNLYRIAVEKGLKHYLNSIKTVFHGKSANWLPPGYKTDGENSTRYLRQKSKRKPFADMIEALIGAFLISTNYSTTIKFMKWLGLDVIQLDDMVKIPSVLSIIEANDISTCKISFKRRYDEYSFFEIEKKINYNFKDRAYLIAAFTHPSCSDKSIAIIYKRLKFVGNALLEFLITRYIFVTKKSVTPGHVTNVRQDLLNNKRKAIIMVANDIHKKIICSSAKLINPEPSNTDDKDFSINEDNINQLDDSKIPPAVAEVFEALIGAIFIDSDYVLKIVWDVIGPLFQRYAKMDSSIENPNLNPVRSVHERHGIITDGTNDDKGNFTCSVELPNRAEVKGSGKSKKSAHENACKKVKK